MMMMTMMKPFFLYAALGGIASATTCMAFAPREMMQRSSKALQATKESESSSSWSEYKSDYIDPAISNEDHTSHVSGPHVDKTKRDSSDQYWLAQFEDEREKLHHMNDPWKNTSGSPKSSSKKTVTPFDQYENEYLHGKEVEHKQVLKGGYVDDEVRAKADEFWLQTFLDEKAKLHGKAAGKAVGDDKKATP